MVPPIPSAGPGAAAKRSKWSRWRKIFAVLGALILVFVGAYVVYGTLNGLPPQVLSEGGQGRTYLDVAFMTMYTPTVPGASNFNVTTTVTFGKAWQFPLTWGGVEGTALPVRFVLASSDGFAGNSANGFTLPGSLAGGTVAVVGPHPPAALVLSLAMNYTVRELSAWEGFGQATWLQVDYSLTPVKLSFGDPLPAANVSAPGASDLVAMGITDDLNLSIQPGYTWPIAHDILNGTGVARTFRHTLPPVTFDAGSAGTFTASLTSSFAWSKGDNYRVVMSFSGTLHGYLTWYWDDRFGSLYTVVSS